MHGFLLACTLCIPRPALSLDCLGRAIRIRPHRAVEAPSVRRLQQAEPTRFVIAPFVRPYEPLIADPDAVA